MPGSTPLVTNQVRLTAVSFQAFRSQTPAVVGARALTPVHFHVPTAVGNAPLEPPADVTFGPPDVPQVADQSGNLFTDRAHPGGMWYLPAFVPVDDPDQAFGFAASQTGTDSRGDPFNKCRVTLTLRKVMPADVAAWRAANPAAPLREVPLEDLEAAVVVRAVNPTTGAVEETPCPATVTPAGADWLVTADNILGDQVVVLYRNLSQEGQAGLVVSASYRVWRLQPRPPVPPGRFVTMIARFEVAAVPLVVNLQLGRRYAADAYRLRYTITAGAVTRPILGADDLRSFNVLQTEFEELRVLGDVSGRYPSISKLYYGVLSRSLVVVPARYVILRDSGTCAAACSALVDSSPGLSAGCKFQFEFTLVPDVSTIDLAQLLNEVNARDDLRGAVLKLPAAIKPDAATALATQFATSFRYADGPGAAHTVALSVEVREQAGGAPAVANANVLINQLRVVNEPFLHGTIGIRLDDAFPSPIDVPVLLNFTATQSAGGTAGVTLRVDEPNGKAVLVNESAFDLSVSRVAFLSGASTTVVKVGQPLPKNGTLALDLPANHAGLSLLFDCELALSGPVSKADLFKYLQFQTVDVQNTQFQFGVNGSAVNFATRGIDRLEVAITLTRAPQIAIPALTLLKDRVFDSTRVLLPLDQALVELAATLLITVHFTDPARPPARATVTNDFASHPVLVINESDLPLGPGG